MRNSLDSLSVPTAILIGSAIIAGSVLFVGSRLSGGYAGTAGALVSPAQPIAPTGDDAQPAAKAADVSQVKTAGDPIVGSATAPIEIAYWFDYQCPFCRQNEETVMLEILKDYVDTGKIRIVYKDFQFLGPDSDSLAVVARAVWQLAPDQFAAWHKAIFDDQGKENSGWATPDEIKTITTGVLGADLTAKVLALASADKAQFQTAIDADKAEGQAFGVDATPSLMIGSKLLVGAYPYDTIKSDIDAALSAK